MGNRYTRLQDTPAKVLHLVDKESSAIFDGFFSGKKDTYNNFYNKLSKIPEDHPVDIIIQTNGGSALWCYKICHLLRNRKGKSRAFIKSYAHSAGTCMALAASELYITSDSTFSGIDAQGSPLQYIFGTGLQHWAKLATDPKSALSDMSKEKSDYHRRVLFDTINYDIHDRDKIMKYMHDEVSTHEQLFFKENMDELGIIYKLWNGNMYNLPRDEKRE